VRPETERGPSAVRRAIAALGYQETINYSFVEESWERDLAGNANPIRLLNPIASQMSVMRSSLIGSLLQVVKFNADRRADRVRVFELGRVFLRDESVAESDATVQGFDQPMKVSGMAWGPLEPLNWTGKSRLVDFFDVKADVERLLAPAQAEFVAAEHPALHPGRSAQVLLNGFVIGHVGELHPRWRQAWDLPHAPVLFELDLDAVTQHSVPVAQPVAKLQAVERDIAVIVREQVTHAQLMQAIRSAPTQGLLRHAVLFDVYRPKTESVGGLAVGEKSLAVRLSLHSDEATLTDAQIEAAMGAVMASLSERVSARLRT
jgi:phenylalanyl-tRNA synthetase beta chain